MKVLNNEVANLQKKKKSTALQLEEAKESIKYSNVEQNQIKETQLKNNLRIQEIDKERERLEAEIYSYMKVGKQPRGKNM